MLIALVGNKGAGKNTIETSFALQQRIREVYSNFFINIPNYHPLHVVDLLTLPNNVDVYIDEAYRWFESRMSMDLTNLLMSYIIFELRKRLMDVYVSVQMFSSLDVRLREQADKIIYCHPRAWDSKDDFKFDIETRYPYDYEEKILYYEDALDIFPYFNTYETIPIRNLQSIEKHLLDEDPDRMILKIEEIIGIIKPQLKKVTKDSVRAVLALNRIHQGYAQLVYLFMKEIIDNPNIIPVES